MLLIFGLILGTIFHEIVGHGVTAMLFGDKVTAAEILFLKINAQGISLVPFSGFGALWHKNTTNPTMLSLIFITLMGSFAPLIASIIFSLLLLLTKSKGFKKTLFICFSLWFIDPLANYVIWPAFGGGGDFRTIIESTGYNIIPFTLISIISALVIGSIIVYKIFNKNKPKLDKILFYGIIIVFVLLLISFFYIILQANNFERRGIEECYKIRDMAREESCISLIALTTNNKDLCEALTLNSTRDNCLLRVSYFYNDPLLCDKIIKGSVKDHCFLGIAIKLKNLSFCDKIINKNTLQECMGEIKE